MYYIGTSGGKKTYTNPHTTGNVIASFSSSATDPSYSQPHKFVGRSNDGYSCTDNRPQSYITLDIGALRSMQVTHYCLKNDGLGTYHVLRNWEFQGRLSESDEWVTLRKHIGDTALSNIAYATASWEINNSLPYRYFRIFQFDVNSYGAHNIMCCGIELYGTLFTCVPEEY